MSMAFFKKPIPEKLNICLITRKVPTIGFLIPIAKGLIQRGHKVGLIAQADFDPGAWMLPEGLSIQSVQTKGLDRLAAQEKIYQAFLNQHAKSPFDIVHCMDSAGEKIGKHRKDHGLAMIYDVEATHLSHLFSILGLSYETLGSLLKTSFLLAYKYLSTYLKFDRGLLRTADALFVHSPTQRIAIERYYLYPDQRIFSVPYGVQIEDLSLKEKSGELLAKLNISPDAQIVLTTSDMTDFAEIKNLIRAFEPLAVKKAHARMVILGTGPLQKQIEYEVLNHALGRRVVFAGEIPNHQLSDYICLADVFVNLSARASSVEQSLLEAMAQKKLVIASEVSPVSSVISNQEDGILIRPADHYTLTELLFRVFNHQIDSTQMGLKAREKVLNLFDPAKMVEKTLEGYQLALSRR